MPNKNKPKTKPPRRKKKRTKKKKKTIRDYVTIRDEGPLGAVNRRKKELDKILYQ